MSRATVSHQTPAGTNLTIIHLQSTAAARAEVNHILLGSDATPANLAGEFTLAATTATLAGGTALTEVDVAQIATPVVAAVGGTVTTEPTYGNIFLMVPLNQQATFQWWANPNFEPKALASTTAGVGLRSIAHGGVPNINLTLMWAEEWRVSVCIALTSLDSQAFIGAQATVLNGISAIFPRHNERVLFLFLLIWKPADAIRKKRFQ